MDLKKAPHQAVRACSVVRILNLRLSFARGEKVEGFQTLRVSTRLVQHTPCVTSLTFHQKFRKINFIK